MVETAIVGRRLLPTGEGVVEDAVHGHAVEHLVELVPLPVSGRPGEGHLDLLALGHRAPRRRLRVLVQIAGRLLAKGMVTAVELLSGHLIPRWFSTPRCQCHWR